MRQKIELNAQGKALLAKTFNVTVQNVSQALLFHRNSVQACRIREAALQHGGKLVEIREVKSRGFSNFQCLLRCGRDSNPRPHA